MGVFLRRGERCVPQQLLDGSQVGAPFQHMGGEGVPQGVRRDPFEGGNPQNMGVNYACDAAAVDASSTGVEK